MHKIFVIFITTFLLITLVDCTSRKGESQSVVEVVDFGNVQTCKSSELIRVERFLPLETSDRSLLGSIDQLEVWKDRIYLLDTYKTNAVLVFSATDGKFIHKIEGRGNGPGEFLSPHSFWIDRSDGSLYILDRMMSKLLRYDLESLDYEEEIKLPDLAPLAFCVPMPVGTDEDLLVGSLSLLDMEEKIISPELKACLKQADEEGNPVLVFYNLK